MLTHGPLKVRPNNSHNRLKFNRPPSYPVYTIISYKERSKFNISIAYFSNKVNNCEKCKKRTIWNRNCKKMINKCTAFCCSTGNNSQRKDEDGVKLWTFYFPKNKPDIFQAWVKFVNWQDKKPSSWSVLCEKHFTEDVIIRGFRNRLQSQEFIPLRYVSRLKSVILSAIS